MNNLNLPDGTCVEFNIQQVFGTGKIRGITTSLPIVGTIYIIEVDEPFDKSVYNYSCFACPSVYLKTI